jgi:hypothetical protein
VFFSKQCFQNHDSPFIKFSGGSDIDRSVQIHTIWLISVI